MTSAEARRQIKRNNENLAKLSDVEKTLNSLPPEPSGTPEAIRRQKLLDAVHAKQADLAKANKLLEKHLASKDETEREQIAQEVEALNHKYRDTSGFPGGKPDDPCAPCTLADDAWDIIEVGPSWERQYVNIDTKCKPKQTPKERHGRTIEVWAKISPKKRGKRVYWTLHAAAGNRQVHFSQAAPAGGTAPPLPATHQAKLYHASTMTDRKGIARVKLDLSLYGGDKFQVSASRTPPVTPPSVPSAGATRRTGIFEVWRKMWYGIVEMKKPSGGGTFTISATSLGLVRAAYEKVFVEVLDSGEKKTRKYVENFQTHDDAYKWADKGTTKKYVPWKIVYSAVHYCVPLTNRETRTHSQAITNTVQTLTGSFSPYDFIDPSTGKRHNWIVSVQATDASGTVHAVPKSVIRRVSSAPGSTQLTVDFSGTTITPSTTNTYTLSLIYYHAPGYGGWGGLNLHLIICRGSMDPTYGTGIDAAMGGVCTHEPGHALGLVYSLPWKTTTHGNHCSVKACVMWYMAYVGLPTDFHVKDDAGNAVDPNCHTFMRGRDMSRSQMAKFKFPR
jgi:hypothetical protein